MPFYKTPRKEQQLLDAWNSLLKSTKALSNRITTDNIVGRPFFQAVLREEMGCLKRDIELMFTQLDVNYEYSEDPQREPDSGL